MPASLKVISLLLPAVVLAGCTNSNQSISPSPDASAITDSNPYIITGSSSFTLDQVALHNSATSCWIVINQQVYDVTSFIPDHPGGEKILTGCGQDMTPFITTTHKPIDDRLPQFLIGSLQP